MLKLHSNKMMIMKMNSIFLLGLTLFASATFADVAKSPKTGGSKGKSLSEMYSGSNAERKVNESRRNYAPSAKKNAEVFGKGKNTERKRNRFKIEDILEIIIEEKGGYGTFPKETRPKKKMETGVLL
jgi:hypothetical protein